MDDERAVDRVLAGDAAAFASIVQRWQGPLVNLAYRFCRDRSRAEDLAQEAFLRAFRGLPKWRREAVFSTWLFALATNLFRSEIRRIPPVLTPLWEISDETDSQSPEEVAVLEDHSQAVQRAVHALPPKYRDVVILFYFHEMDISRTASSLNLPQGTVKARLSRGRNMLRQKLATMLASRGVAHATR